MQMVCLEEMALAKEAVIICYDAHIVPPVLHDHRMHYSGESAMLALSSRIWTQTRLRARRSNSARECRKALFIGELVLHSRPADYRYVVVVAQHARHDGS